MAKLKLVIEMTYDADPEHYGTTDPAEMARIDQTGAQDDPTVFLSVLEDRGFTVTVNPVEE